VSGNLHFISLSAGFQHTCGMIAGGQMYCWGSNDAGALGDGTQTTRNVPVLIAAKN
jgi:alpha-tubulin suppressor-like RCC1 family protein